MINKETQEIVEKFLAKMKDSSKHVRTWTLEEQEILYSSAYSLYQQASYEKASQLFTQLTMTNPFDEKYWRGLASSLQMERKWESSLHAWGLSALLAEHDPLPHFHAAECLFSNSQNEEALKALAQAELRVNKQKDAHLLGKIDVLKQLCAGEYL